MLKEIKDYLNDKFPEYWNDINIRMELGEPYRNGSKRRIAQVNKRVNTIFKELFKPTDLIYLIIKDWGKYEDPMFGNTTPEYLDELLQGKILEEETLFDIDEDKDDEGNKIEIQHEYRFRVLECLVSAIPYKEIFEGISHYEQGTPESLHFEQREEHIISYVR